MIQREIFYVIANIVDANGTFNALSGYPKVFDSKHYGNDVEKTKQRAYADWHDVLGAMGKVDTRELQLASIIRMSDGMQVEFAKYGNLKPLPDPEPDEQA